MFWDLGFRAYGLGLGFRVLHPIPVAVKELNLSYHDMGR